ncbi:MAG: ribbon-helix-helix protein, CopG family [Pseudonocardiaceae bacterium]
MSGSSGRSNRVDLRVDDKTYDAIRRIAHDSDRNVSDVVRDAIRRYLQAS